MVMRRVKDLWPAFQYSHRKSTMTEVVKVCYRFLWKRWSQSPERFTTALKPRRSFSPGFQKEQQQKASAKIPQKPCEMDKMASWIIMIYLFIRPMPPDRLVVVDSETQEIAWRRSQVDHFDRKKYLWNLRMSPEQGSEEVQVQNQEGKRAMSRVPCGRPGPRRWKHKIHNSARFSGLTN